MGTLRTFLEILARNKILKRKLPKDFGRTPMYVSPDAQLKYFKLGGNIFDAELLHIVREEIKPGMHIWDIGANIGVFSFAAASVAQNTSVICVEPDIWLAQLIRKSAALPANRHLNIQVLSTAIADRNGIATFFVAKRGRASNTLEIAGGSSQMGGIRNREMVSTLTLDTLLDFCSPPDFVKIDVEGAETIALHGAARLLKEIRPLIYIEVSGRSREQVTALLHANGYELFEFSSKHTERSPVRACVHNTLAVPG